MKRILYNAGTAAVVGSAVFLGAGGALLKGLNNLFSGAFSFQTKVFSENQLLSNGASTLSQSVGVPSAYAEAAGGGGGDSASDSGGGGDSGSCCC